MDYGRIVGVPCPRRPHDEQEALEADLAMEETHLATLGDVAAVRRRAFADLGESIQVAAEAVRGWERLDEQYRSAEDAFGAALERLANVLGRVQ